MIVSVTVDELAAAVFAEAEAHSPRTPERRAACHAWSALITSPTVPAAVRAIETFGDPGTQEAARAVLYRLAGERTPA